MLILNVLMFKRFPNLWCQLNPEKRTNFDQSNLAGNFHWSGLDPAANDAPAPYLRCSHNKLPTKCNISQTNSSQPSMHTVFRHNYISRYLAIFMCKLLPILPPGICLEISALIHRSIYVQICAQISVKREILIYSLILKQVRV